MPRSRVTYAPCFLKSHLANCFEKKKKNGGSKKDFILIKSKKTVLSLHSIDNVLINDSVTINAKFPSKDFMQ